MQRIAVIGNPGSWSTEKLADAFEAETGFRRVVDMSRVHMDLDKGRMWFDGEELSTFDALAVKKIGPAYSPDMQDRLSLLDLLARNGTPIFSKPAAILAALNRLSCTVILRAGKMPMPPTTITEDVEAAVEAVESYGRAVFKPLYTSKARGMEVIQADPSCRERITRFQAQGNPVMYIQKMLDTPGKDLGIVFLGGEYYGTYARQSGGAWNTSTSSGGKYAHYDPSQDVVDLAWKAQNLFGLDFTCVDVMETKDGPMIFEVSAFGGFRGLLEARGLDASVHFAEHVLKRVQS